MVVIIDYGVGNVGSVFNMLRKIKVKAIVSRDPSEIQAASKLILPGVGSFSAGMASLNETGLVPLLKQQVMDDKKPTLGICLGMQMMTNGSEEGDSKGLGWVDGYTQKFSKLAGVKVPHMGWNAIYPKLGAQLFGMDSAELERFYFVHSYYVKLARAEDAAATCLYGGEFTASFQVGNVYGVQFHPEKSHIFGMNLLKRFVDI